MRRPHFNLLIVCWITINIGTHFYPVESRVALILNPYELPDDPPILSSITNWATQLLRSYGFTTISCDTSYIPKIQAHTVVVFYTGHGNPDRAVAQVRLGAFIEPTTILNRINSVKTIFLIDACYAGNWMPYAQPNQIIISAVNNTKHRVHYDATTFIPEKTDTFIYLLEFCQFYSLETAFHFWKNLQITIHQESCSIPIMHDGIEGEVYLPLFIQNIQF